MLKDKDTVIRMAYRFTGRVQGVGFRYRAVHAASGMRITGWVQNAWDGSVLMEAQGTEYQLQELLKAINHGTYIEIERIESKEIDVRDDEHGFSVRYEDT